MHQLSTEEQQLENEALSLQIQELETVLDQKEEEIDRLNTEILELQRGYADVDQIRRDARLDITKYQANILRFIDSVDGLPTEEWMRRTHHFLYELKHYIEQEGDARRYLKAQSFSVNPVLIKLNL